MTITDALAGSAITGAAVWFAPAGTDPTEAGEWREVGWTDQFRPLDPPRVDSEAIRAAMERTRPVIEQAQAGFEAFRVAADAAAASFDKALAAWRTELHYSFQVQNPSDYLSLLGFPVEADARHPRNSMTIRYQKAALRPKPGRTPGWTARRYRAERRRWGREYRAWKRAGMPKQEHRIVLPNVTIEEAP